MREMYPVNGRVILHIDCDAFYASVESVYYPSLKNKPLAIAGNPNERRGIIITCNYIARSYGIYTTMPLWEAKKKCPDLVIKAPNFELYKNTSIKVFDYLTTYSDVLEPASIDEGYLDITHCHDKGNPLEIAKKIQQGILKTFDIPVSIGIGPNKFLAKMASSFKKPMGISVFRKREVEAILWGKQVKEMHGIGQKTAEKLNSIGIDTIGDLAKVEVNVIRKLLGITGVQLKERANGIDDRPVNPEVVHQRKTIGNSHTLSKDVSEELILFDVLKKLSDSVSKRLAAHNVLTQSIQITIKYSDFYTITRSRKLEIPIIDAKDIFKATVKLFNENWDGDSVRLLGITALNIIEKKQFMKQLDLFTYTEEVKHEPLLKTIDTLKDRFGDGIVKRGSDLISKQRL